MLQEMGTMGQTSWLNIDLLTVLDELQYDVGIMYMDDMKSIKR